MSLPAGQTNSIQQDFGGAREHGKSRCRRVIPRPREAGAMRGPDLRAGPAAIVQEVSAGADLDDTGRPAERTREWSVHAHYPIGRYWWNWWSGHSATSGADCSNVGRFSWP